MTNVQKRSKLTFIKNTSGGKHAKALYKCECGKDKECFVDNVKRLHTVSCGCERSNSRKSVTHGLRYHPLYKIWAGIKNRCTNDRGSNRKLYFEKGVKICDEWINNPENFIKWALENEWKKGCDIDKDIKAKKLGLKGLLYSPEWCSVVTRKENVRCTSRNKDLEYKGNTKCINEWSEHFKIDKATFWYRLKKCNFDIYFYVKKWVT